MPDINNLDYNPSPIYEVPQNEVQVQTNRFDFVGGEVADKFVMRAYHTVAPVGYVYWTVSGSPDGTGSVAPYPAIELEDIVVIRTYTPE